ncbi:MAG: DNA-processing protein DprA [Flavobacteriales bacterium]|nr:DNA-processing protein DprA [Flavobacteriales bacterium]
MNQSNKNNISIICSKDEKYPTLLKECEDRPPFLFIKGNYNPNQNILISVVGTRSSTSYGETFCQELSRELSSFNVGIVSGLAYGIDFHIHKKSLDLNIPNVGVLGSGINNVYPFEHQKLSEKIMENGLLLSENSPNTPPIAYNFPKRNRIIAGMAQATIIIESPLKGGAIITAKLANDYHRDVYAVPGSILQRNSKGCNQLIKSHQACLIDNPSELIKQLGLKEKNEDFIANTLREFNNETEKLIYKLIQKEKEISMDKLQQLTQINFPELNEVLFSLELNDSIKQYPGKIYTL